MEKPLAKEISALKGIQVLTGKTVGEISGKAFSPTTGLEASKGRIVS